ncbi:bacillithiol biosynthesis cysteine-adding enzyme BshC [Lacihabitans lacunae]|uniref:Putative cysteine ligase BshC n=1 Tax=Lacihabitans lacunae TaxID=1028214 RepID=A0ABV7Z129_9BACT
MQKIPFAQTGAFQKIFLDFISKEPAITPFYDEFPDLEGFEAMITKRKFTHRKELVSALKNQYINQTIPNGVELLASDDTFCVTTGHQLNIFTGPLYVVFKIISTINLAKKLKETYPNKNFVPVYWMATEDHDFEEIASFSLFGQKHTWETTQTGAVGKMDPRELASVLDALKEKPSIFEKAYLNNTTLTAAVREYMHALFGTEELVCIDGDDKILKTLFQDILTDDLLNHSAETEVAKTSAKLEEVGYKAQIHARNINLFYLKDNIRERIEKDGDVYNVINTDISFSKTEIKEMIASEPESFSPNVVLRPIYQERILPNLAYIGGPSELAYWLQLKGIFDKFEVSFPILCPRNFGLIVNSATKKRIDKLGIEVTDLFQDEVSLRRGFVEKNSSNSLELSEQIFKINDIYKEILKKAEAIDPTLKSVVEADKTKNQNNLENLEKRLKKAEEKNFETSVSQLLNLKEKLFPGDGLQERKENFLNFYINDPEFLNKVSKEFDPLEFSFNIINV